MDQRIAKKNMVMSRPRLTGKNKRVVVTYMRLKTMSAESSATIFALVNNITRQHQTDLDGLC